MTIERAWNGSGKWYEREIWRCRYDHDDGHMTVIYLWAWTKRGARRKFLRRYV